MVFSAVDLGFARRSKRQRSSYLDDETGMSVARASSRCAAGVSGTSGPDGHACTSVAVSTITAGNVRTTKLSA